MIIRIWLIYLWDFLDPVYYCCTRLFHLKLEEKYSVFRVRKTKYRGPDIILSDGSSLKKNDIVIKIHLHNSRLLKQLVHIKSPVSRGRALIRIVGESMPCLALHLEKHPDSDLIKGVIGITMINKGYQILGFERHPLTHRGYILLKQLMQAPIYFLSQPKAKWKDLKDAAPAYLVMTKQQLAAKYRQSLLQQ
ncbi:MULTISPECIES: YkoP family protein [Bacillaceae]|uniref:YkoP-like domain-containing protein n=1 Tax=Bacillus infantis TaxID=324767 RepID=A0A5D4SSR1_9BACI|nr:MULTISPECIES: hypothetical protein [Bacillus]MCA1034864.1 hypothetical protein [Bacillus infantis]MCK6205362.1 hypothetical protein [Bacillus infantis]MCP1158545.1 hypothetical protein [Bacillus infantis]MDT0158863.1 hypothetical protein [Bacillus sp. AG4(2022)]MDW2878906.1 hypothetical protein [Bacillus infantis]